MPKIIERKILEEKCPECPKTSKLTMITESWEPFPEDGILLVKLKRCNKCGYEKVIRNDLSPQEKVPYVRHEKNFQYA